MSYGKLQRLLSEEFPNLRLHHSILLESLFIETTRSGKYLYYVFLALTPGQVMIALQSTPKVSKSQDPDINNIKLQYLYPLELVQINVFKRSRRQTLKFYIEFGKTRYFELAATKKREIIWELWCYHAAKLGVTRKLQHNEIRTSKRDGKNDYKIIGDDKTNILKWRDKYLYLGTKREKEDEFRPTPVPGLGPGEDLKLLYLKPKYFGCWDQSEHWVQCESSGFVTQQILSIWQFQDLINLEQCNTVMDVRL